MRQSVPEDGLPCLDDWMAVWEGMLFGGVELAREPVDIAVFWPLLRTEFKEYGLLRSCEFDLRHQWHQVGFLMAWCSVATFF